MNENFIKVINTLLDKGIEIGSKNGTGKLHWDDITSNVVLETRYGYVASIDLNDPVGSISSEAWGWYLDYKDRGYGPSETWLPIWIEEGRIEKKIVQKIEYVIN
jgi:hypothetical protein